MTTNEGNNFNTELEEIEAVMGLADGLTGRLRRLLGEDGINKAHVSNKQYSMLAKLDRNGSMSIGKLAHSLGIAQSTASEMISRLEKYGLVDKERSKQDERVAYARLNNSGKQVVRIKRQLVEKRYHELVGQLDEVEKEKLLKLMEYTQTILSTKL